MTLYIAKKSRYCFRFVCLLICLRSFFFFLVWFTEGKENQTAAHRIRGEKALLSNQQRAPLPRCQKQLIWQTKTSTGTHAMGLEDLWIPLLLKRQHMEYSTWSPISQELSNCAHLTRVWHRAVLHSQVAISTVGSWRHWVLSESLMFKDPSLSCAGIYSSLCFGCTSPWFIFFSTQSTWDYEWWNAVNLPCYSGWIFSSAKYKQPILKWSSLTMNGSL